MAFLALKKSSNLTDSESEYYSNTAVKIFFSPTPLLKENDYPTVWLDLHLCNDVYEKCGKDKKLNFIRRRINEIEQYYVTIRPMESLRFRTAERIGVKDDVVGLVVNSASRAIKGLLVAPGKIDPGFKPNQLTLVMTNLSRRSIRLKAGYNGDKIAAIAFLGVSEYCVPTNSTGWSDKPLPINDYTPTRIEIIKDKILNLDYRHIFSVLIGALLVWLFGSLVK